MSNAKAKKIDKTGKAGVKAKPSARKATPAKRIRLVSLSKLLPNMLTICSLCAGLTSIRFALLEKWEFVIIAIVIAAIFDVLDGAVARLLKASSKMGAELDSLSDFLSFGVAPALILYLWVIQNAGGMGWFACMVLAVGAALRLARFNTQAKEQTKKGNTEPSHFFVGVPAPAGALLSLIPLCVSLHFGENSMEDYPITSVLVAFWILVVAGLMVSTVPTFSIKKLKIPQKLVFFVFIVLGLLIASLVTEPWLTISALGVGYLLSIPFSYRVARKMLKD